jgi:hypothetical protein
MILNNDLGLSRSAGNRMRWAACPLTARIDGSIALRKTEPSKKIDVNSGLDLLSW